MSEAILVAVPSNAPAGLEAVPSAHFGHCDAYTVARIQDGRILDVSVEYNEGHEQGGCIVPVQALSDKGVGVLIAGGMGMGPLNAMHQMGMQVFYASGYSAATGLPFESLCAEIHAMIRVAFLPFSMLPPCGTTEESRFDAMWLTNLCGIAARETNEKISDVYWRMSLTEVCCHYVNYRRRECADGDKIRRRPDLETIERIEARVDELAEKFLREKPDGSGGETETKN